MLLERYYDDSLAQASYLIGCERSGDAIVIDPHRDIERYQRAAAAHRMRIKYVTETHIHADFLSGARDLARASQAVLSLSDHGGDDWSYRYVAGEGGRLVRDGERLEVGKVRLDVLHTPGHTPEHISFLVTDTATGSEPMGMLSGDFLFVGDVGRPDLLERAANAVGTMKAGAAQLFASLQKLARLPDYLQIWPGHGSGSACGKALGAVPQSTLGYERLFNPALQQKTEPAFVDWVLADQPEPPRYFAMMKRLNRDGPPARPKADDVPQLDGKAVDAAIASGQQVVDLRGSAEFAVAHLPGTTNIPASKNLPTYAGTVLTYDRPIVLVGKSRDQAQASLRQLSLIGLDQIAGWAALDVLQQAQSQGRQLQTVRTIEARKLAGLLENGATSVIDVRGTAEWRDGHIAQATHMYLGDLVDRARDLDRDAPIVLHCQGGSRSSIGASLLLANGFTNVTNLVGGLDAWRRAELPITRDKS